MPKRRSPGDGSIIQRKDGVWLASIELPRRPGEPRRRRWFSGKTREEARQRMLKAQRDGDIEITGRSDYASRPLRDWFDRWIIEVQETRAAQTAYTYRQHMERHVLPYLGRVRLRDIDAERVTAWLAALRRKRVPTKDGTRTLGASAIQHAYVALRTCLSVAYRRSHIVDNTCLRVERPRHRAVERATLSQKQILELFTAMSGHRLESLIFLVVGTGGREGELLALRWPNVDVKARMLRIRENVALVGNDFVRGAPKSERSLREIPIPQFAADALVRHRERMIAEGRDVFSGLVFPADDEQRWKRAHIREDGTWPPQPNRPPIRRQNLLRHALYPALERAGLPRVTFHDLRHSYATLARERGMTIEAISRSLGHANTVVTNAIYNHAFRDQTREIADALDAALGADERTMYERKYERPKLDGTVSK